jgi:hypothetical protein
MMAGAGIYAGAIGGIINGDIKASEIGGLLLDFPIPADVVSQEYYRFRLFGVTAMLLTSCGLSSFALLANTDWEIASLMNE